MVCVEAKEGGEPVIKHRRVFHGGSGEIECGGRELQMRMKDAVAKKVCIRALCSQGKFGFYIFPKSSCKVFLYSKKLEVPFEPPL